MWAEISFPSVEYTMYFGNTVNHSQKFKVLISFSKLELYTRLVASSLLGKLK